jgi:DNA helicase-2/ATP-dependent DNA helicase PcrA
MPFLTVNSYFPPKKGGGKQSNNLLKEYGCADKFENNEESYRRVYYVGVTRSKKYLYMTQSPEFYGNGKQYKKPAPAFKEALHSDYVLQNADYKPEYDRVQKDREESSESYVVDFSTLKDYYLCPYKFKISSIYGFREPLDYRMGHGKSLHNILNEIHTKHKKGEEYDVEEIIERQYHLPYAPPKLTEDMKKTAYEEVTAYIENNKDSFDDIELIEEYIEFKTSDGNIDIFINGRIDLVKNTKDGKIKVVDFKSDKNTLPRKLEKEQLMIYALGYLHLRGKMPDAVESYHLKEKHPIIEYPSPEKLKKVEDNIHEIIKNIKKNNFKKAIETKGEEVCKSIDCPYLNECKKQYIQ